VKIALIASPTNINRFSPGFIPFVHEGYEFWQIDIYRPLEEITELLDQWKPDGIISEYILGLTRPILDKIQLPVVICPNDAEDFKYENCRYVDVNDREVGYSVARYFLNQGYREIAFYGNNTHYSEQRLKGYESFLNTKGLQVHKFIERVEVVRRYTEYWQDHQSTASEWLQSLPKPCAIFTAHDPLGRSLLERCRQLGIKIPDDFAVISANNDPLICDLVNPPLSSVRIPWAQIGYQATQNLVKICKKNFDFPLTTLIEPSLIEHRQSSDMLYIDNPVLVQAVYFIRNNISANLSVEEVVSHCRVSRRSLEKLFQLYLKKTPREEIVRLKVERAERLLLDTSMQMPEIAEKSGFSSAERFSVSFKQVTLLTPTAYRKKFQKVV
jgi:LacI family transcriptional regulator